MVAACEGPAAKPLPWGPMFRTMPPAARWSKPPWTNGAASTFWSIMPAPRNLWTTPIWTAWTKPILRRFMPSTPLRPTKWCAPLTASQKLRGRQCGEHFIRCRCARCRVFGGLCGIQGGPEFDDAGFAARWARIIFGSMRYARLCRHGLVPQCLGEEMFDRCRRAKNRPPCRAGTPDDISGPILFFANRASKRDRTIARGRCRNASGHAGEDWLTSKRTQRKRVMDREALKTGLRHN